MNTATKSKRNNPSSAVKFYLACALIFVGVILLFSAFWVPPTGNIHESVLIAFGQILVFSGALIGIDYNYRYKTIQLQSKLHDMVREEISRREEAIEKEESNESID